MISKKTITLTAALIAIGSMTSSVLAADINMRLATMVKSPHPFIDMAAFFKKEVEAKSSGRIAVKIFPAASLGKDQAVIGEMKLGSVDLMISSTFGAVRQVPEFQVFSLPYLFSGLDAAMGKIAPGTAVHKYFEKIYADRNTGMKLLALGVSGTRNLSNAKRPVKGLSDIKGLKMRTPPSPMISQTWKTLGTLPVSISWPELYAGIQTGVAEGLESSIAGYKGSKLYEVAPHLALTAHMVQISHLSMSARTWKKLSAADKKIVLSMAARASDLGLSKTKGYEAAFVNTLQKNHGVKVTRPNISEFSSVLKPVQSKFATQMKVSEALGLLQ
jgi:tripartite ATP-independent transporter DctP family solute receptor